MNLKGITKLIVKGLSTYSVGIVIDNIVKSTIPFGASPINKTLAHIGGYVISGMVGDAAGEYMDEQLSTIFGIEEPVVDVNAKSAIGQIRNLAKFNQGINDKIRPVIVDLCDKAERGLKEENKNEKTA